jgi:release factor glutamine methyltransferase
MTATLTLRDAIATLRAAGIEDAPRDARLLLAKAMGVPADRLTLHLQDPLSAQAEQAFATLIATRSARQPMAQILGERLFWGRSFEVTRDTLDPRPETEVLVQQAIKQPFANMLDLGTGSGCILISCLLAMPMATGLGVDISDAALRVAARNAARHGVTGARFLASDWLRGVTGGFDLIVSNPPYIAQAEMAALAPEVRDWERITGAAPLRLLPGGRILLEIGPTQAAAVRALLAAQGLEDVQTLPDLDGRDRVVCGRKPMRDTHDLLS